MAYKAVGEVSKSQSSVAIPGNRILNGDPADFLKEPVVFLATGVAN